MPNPVPLQPGQYDHIYNRGLVPPGTGRCNNGKTRFREQRNTPYFLSLYVNYRPRRAGPTRPIRPPAAASDTLAFSHPPHPM